MSFWSTVGGYLQKGAQAFNGALGSAADWYNSGAKEQKNTLNQEAQGWQQWGANQRDYYAGVNNTAQDYFNQTEQDIRDMHTNDTTDPLKRLAADAIGGDYEIGNNLVHGAGNVGQPTQLQDYYTRLQTDPSLRPTEQQDFYKYLDSTKGNLTNQEELYQERKGGTDPAAAYQDQRAVEDINRQLAARGGYSNSAGERQIGDYYANANAQRSQQLAGLAAGADTSRLGVNSALGQAAAGASGEQDAYTGRLGEGAKGASTELADWNAYKEKVGNDLANAQEKRVNDIVGADQNLATAKSAVLDKLAELGGNAMSDAQKESFAAELAASGVDQKQIDKIMDMFGGAAKAGISAVGA